ncbi:MAG: PqqD family peptide modification chaperone [Pyrinomonadaceae bacterium]
MAANQQKQVDIIIAARNEERYIGACLEALRAQDYPKELLRIYLVDNGSTDNTIQIAEQRGAHILIEPKPGASAARNAGISKSTGELVGFLDAHCIPETTWVRVMAEQFKSEELGGCQGRMENKSINSRVQKYLDDSRVYSNERIVEDTVSGKRNIYPWILSGNCMYRREAINEAGLFNEKLRACEDVDLAWRVVLLGYQLFYVPQAQLTHYSCDSWFGFVKKGFHKGRGAAMLSFVYKPHGAREKFVPSQIWSTKPEKLLAGLSYWAGYRQQESRLRLNLDALPTIRYRAQVLAKFRGAFNWTSGVTLRISDDVVFWFRNEKRSSTVIVQIPTKQRVVLDKVGDFIWRRIAQKTNRQDLIEALAAYYGVAPITAGSDLDDLIEELVDATILHKGTPEFNQPRAHLDHRA